MSIATFSPAFVMLFACVLMWILTDMNYHDLNKTQKWLVPLIILVVSVLNHLLRIYLGSALYGKLILFTMHIPFFFLFRYITGLSAVKLIFMILSELIFTTPVIMVSNVVRRYFPDSTAVLFVANLASYIAIAAVIYLFYRKGFSYLLKYGEDKTFLLLSIVPFMYYIYAFAVQYVDMSVFSTTSGYIVRYLPTLEVFAFYFLLLNIFKELSEKRELETEKMVMTQALNSAKERISLLNMAQNQTAIYRHDMRHHLTAIEGFLSAGRPQQASEYIHEVWADIEAVTPKWFCENEMVNLICSSFYAKAKNMKTLFRVKANLPKNISVSDTELCSVVSNGFENALNALKNVSDDKRWLEFYCEIKRGKLLMEFKNPYDGEITIKNGLPVSNKEGHGYGCRSIKSITEHYRGDYNFETENGIFTLRVVLPIEEAEKN